MGQVEGKVAIVTGGASGIGAACAATLAREGASMTGRQRAAPQFRLAPAPRSTTSTTTSHFLTLKTAPLIPTPSRGAPFQLRVVAGPN